MPNTPETLRLLVIFVAMPIHLIATALLLLVLRNDSDNVLLRDRCLSAVFFATGATVFGLVFMSNDMRPPALSVPETQVITRLYWLLSVIPALYWLVRLYLRRAK